MLSKLLPVFLFSVLLSSCATESFQADKRQLLAKDLVRKETGSVKDYDILAFGEDTVAYTDGRRALRYELLVSYRDSRGNMQSSKGR